MTARQNWLVQRHRTQYIGSRSADSQPRTVTDIAAALTFEGTAWQADALCREMDPELFFNDPEAKTSLEEARRACELCPVRETCLDWAVSSFTDDEDQYGVFGGVGPKIRSGLRFERNGQEVAA